mgnify:CR=1 FL=1
MMKNLKTETVLFDTYDLFEREIDEVLEYYHVALIMWATIRFKDDTWTYSVPLYALAIKHKPVFN